MAQISSILTGTIRNLPATFLARAVEGQQIEVRLSKAVLATEKITFHIANTQLEWQSPVDLAAGQRIRLLLAREDGKPVLKLVVLPERNHQTASLVIPHESEETHLRRGQFVSVYVSEILEKDRIRVQLSGTSQQWDINIRQLKQSFHIGDRLVAQIHSTTPLHIHFIPWQALSRAQRIADALRRLSPQQGSLRPLHTRLAAMHTLPRDLRQMIDQWLAPTLGPADLTDAKRFREALMTSGTFLEKNLLTNSNQIADDFKANLNKVLQKLDAYLASQKKVSVQAALSQLPNQIGTALAAKGLTPMQLLHHLLLGYRFPSVMPVSSPNKSWIENHKQALNLAQLLTRPLTQDQAAGSATNQAMALTDFLTLFKELEALQHRIVFNQLRMLQQQANPTSPQWLFELPLRDEQRLDLIQMQIEQFKTGKQKKDKTIWNVKLRLDTRNLGPVQATIIFDGQAIDLIFRAQRETSAQLLSANQNSLHEAMQKLDVAMRRVHCFCAPVAAPAQSDDGRASERTQTGIDIRI